MNYSNLCFGCFKEKQNQICEHCGFDPAQQKAQTPLALPAGTIIAGRYAVGKVSGKTTASIAYTGIDLKVEKPVQINEYLPQSIQARENDEATLLLPSDALDFKNGMNRFIDEAKIIAAIPGNPTLADFIYENNTAYTVLIEARENVKATTSVNAPVTEAPAAKKRKISPALILACASVLLAAVILIVVLGPEKAQPADTNITPDPSAAAGQTMEPTESPEATPVPEATLKPTTEPTPAPSPSPYPTSAPIPYADYESAILGCTIRYPLGFEIHPATKELPTEMFVLDPNIIQLTRYENKTADEWISEVKEAVEGVDGKFELLQEGESVSNANEYNYLTYYIEEEAEYYTATLVMQAGKDIFVLDSVTYSSYADDFNECAGIMIDMMGTLKING